MPRHRPSSRIRRTTRANGADRGRRRTSCRRLAFRSRSPLPMRSGTRLSLRGRPVEAGTRRPIPRCAGGCANGRARRLRPANASTAIFTRKNTLWYCLSCRCPWAGGLAFRLGCHRRRPVGRFGGARGIRRASPSEGQGKQGDPGGLESAMPITGSCPRTRIFMVGNLAGTAYWTRVAGSGHTPCRQKPRLRRIVGSIPPIARGQKNP